MAVLSGKAKRFNGAPVDYVLLFDWQSGQCIGKAIPDAAGVWTYDYFSNINCGITYVADGCEPITHGAYEFLAAPITSGFLLLKYATTADRYRADLDVTNTATSTWTQYFEQLKDIGLISYLNKPSAPVENTFESKIINVFNPDWVLYVHGKSPHTPSSHELNLELLDADNNVIFALQEKKDGAARSGLWYGSSLLSLTKTGQVGAYPSTNGNLSFTPAGVDFNNVPIPDNASDGHNESFTFSCDIASVVKVRVSGSAKAGAEATYSGGWVRILPP